MKTHKLNTSLSTSRSIPILRLEREDINMAREIIGPIVRKETGLICKTYFEKKTVIEIILN
jgi:hypothetical protein